MEYPRLIESNVRMYLTNSLNSCHEYKSCIYSWALNIGVFTLFVLTLGLILYLRRKREIPEHERQAKMLKEQNYVLSKIREYQMDQKRQSTLITDLPLPPSAAHFRYDPLNV